MAIEALWMQNRTFSAREDRALVAALFDEGVLDLTMFEVRADSPAAMTVEITAGTAVVEGDTQTAQNSYTVSSTTIETSAVVSPPAVLPRVDLLVLQVRDPDAGGASGDDAVLVWVTGVEASSPVAPAVPSSALPLAEVALTVGQVSIQPGDITDRRVLAGRKAVPGAMELFSGDPSIVPSGWLRCEGQEVLRSTYPALNALYEAAGYPYGSGNGTTTFNVPDLRDRVPVVAGSSKSVGGAGGAASRVITNANLPTHTHTVSAHTHGLGGHTHSFSATTGTSGSHVHTVNGDFLAFSNPSGSFFGAYRVAPGTGQYVFAYNSNDQVFAPSQTNANGGHTHSVSGTTAGNNGNTTSSGGGSTSASGSSTAFNVEQPYAVLGSWLVRT